MEVSVRVRGLSLPAKATLQRWSPDDGEKIEVEGTLTVDQGHSSFRFNRSLPEGKWQIVATECVSGAFHL